MSRILSLRLIHAMHALTSNYILPLEMCQYIHTVGVSGTGQSHASVIS